ncbi:MAG: hypothetical protein CL940_11665 [Deltaproteobacteria bacterium]|nr:hypothetical protein [Deltaproteobacteria bacterium]
MRRFVTFVFAALLLAACSEEESGQTPGPVTDPTDAVADTAQDASGDTGSATDGSLDDLASPGDAISEPDPGPPACPAAGVEVVTFETADGLTLEADLHRTDATASAAVILLHMIPPGNDRTNYPLSFREKLHEAGFTVLNVDRRGAGGSEGVATDAYQGPNGKLDAAAAVSALTALPCPPDLSRLAIIGASNGTTTALDYALHAAKNPEEDPVPRAMVFLTGGPYTENQNELGAVLENPELDEVPILFVYPQDEASWSESYKDTATHWTHKAYEQSGHGTHLFDSAPVSMTDVTEWLVDAL